MQLVGDFMVHALGLWYLGLGCALALRWFEGLGMGAQLRGVEGFWVKHCFPWDHILLYGADILSSSAIVFTLVLNGVALGCRGLVSNGARD